MADHRNDKLAKTLSGINADNRFTTWLWFFIKNQSPQTNLGELKSPGVRDRMAELISQEPQRARFIEEQSDLFLLPEQDLQWITNNRRQNIFLVQKLAEKNGNNYLTTTNLTGRDLTIAIIDIWPINKTQKSALVTQIKFEWKKQTDTDQIFNWFDGAEENEKSKLACELIPKKFSSPPPYTSQPLTKEELLIYFDTPCFSASDKELFVTLVKKRWSQKKYRAKMTGKNQYNFILSDNAIKRLDKLANKHGIKRTQILEILLQMEEEKGIYIPKRMQALMDI
jgi:hypothetical protein